MRLVFCQLNKRIARLHEFCPCYPTMMRTYQFDLSLFLLLVTPEINSLKGSEVSLLLLNVLPLYPIIAIIIMSFLYMYCICRYHKIGVLVLWVHDVTDIALEFTKCNVYFKNRGGKFYKFHDILSTMGFLCFAICWLVSQHTLLTINESFFYSGGSYN